MGVGGYVPGAGFILGALAGRGAIPLEDEGVEEHF